MTQELTSAVAKVPRNSNGERIGEKREFTVAGEEYYAYFIPMSIGDQMELEQSDINYDDFSNIDVIWEMFDRFLGPQTKDELKTGDEFDEDDLVDLRGGFAIALVDEMSSAAGVEMDEEDLEEIKETIEESQEGN